MAERCPSQLSRCSCSLDDQHEPPCICDVPACGGRWVTTVYRLPMGMSDLARPYRIGIDPEPTLKEQVASGVPAKLAGG